MAEDQLLTHNHAMAIFRNSIAEMTKDSLLASLPNDVTIDEVNSLIALDYGLAMTVTVCKDSRERIAVIVPQTATIKQFKKAFQRQTLLHLKRKGESRRINWKYYWKSYWLIYEGIKLEKDDSNLIEYGIGNGAMLTFAKRLQQKGRVKSYNAQL
ncbi:U11/U12 small nuclear ribonucleoprotein 25 kDa protein [Trichoplax sp. H2]|nr:U11/U12 small nuclear ribonucleoprotein 25 kDa protein [Trichoplax sp. H2]|eukprot:RDD42129.1 U11/U12 small nuclear ribonucleoprotein 25 kDa protein [Trichoplax sp. H2]